MIDHLNAFVLIVKDVRKCAEFYEQKLGFKLQEMDDDFAYLTLSQSPRPGVALVSMKGIAEELPSDKVLERKDSAFRSYFASFLGDADKEYEELSKKGVHFVVPPSTRPNGQRYAFFEDPEGNLWEISHFPKE